MGMPVTCRLRQRHNDRRPMSVCLPEAARGRAVATSDSGVFGGIGFGCELLDDWGGGLAGQIIRATAGHLHGRTMGLAVFHGAGEMRPALACVGPRGGDGMSCQTSHSARVAAIPERRLVSAV